MHACLPVKNWFGRNSTPRATCFKDAKLILLWSQWEISFHSWRAHRCRCLDLSLVLKQRPGEARGVTKRRRRKILPVHTRNDEYFLIKSDVHRKHPLQSTYVHLMCSSQLPSQSRGFESAQEFSPHTCHRERFNKLELNLHGSTRRFSQLRLSNVFYWNLRACYWTILSRYSDFI